MADAPVQAINIDPNLLVNATNTGMAAGFNYGQGAQDARAAAAQATAMQANFLYGQDAFVDRAVNVRTNFMASNFNYGEAAQDQQEARTKNLDSVTAGNLLANEISTYNLQQRKLDDDSFGVVRRDNTTLAAQAERRRRDAIAQVEMSPAGQLGLANLAQDYAGIEQNQVHLNLKNTQHQLKTQDLTQNSAYADLLSQEQVRERARRQIDNRMSFQSELVKATQADNEARATLGQLNPSRQIATLHNLLTTDYEKFGDNGTTILPLAQQLSQTYGLSPDDRDKIDQVVSAATFDGHGKEIQGTMSGLVQARGAGNISPTGEALLSATASIGINPRSELDVLRMSVDKVGDNYVLTNTATNRQSKPYTPEEFNSSPELQALFVASENRKANRQNTLTKTDDDLKKLDEVITAPIHADLRAPFLALEKSLRGQVADQDGFTTKAAGVFTRATQDLEMVNPFFHAELGPKLLDVLGVKDSTLTKLVTGKLSPVTEALGLREPDDFDRMIKDDPNLARTLVTAYENRERAGLTPEMYKSYVEELALNAERGDPRYVRGGANSDAAVAERKRLLRANIQRSLKVPTMEEAQKMAYERVIQVYPEMRTDDTSQRVPSDPKSLVQRIGASLRRNIFDKSHEDIVQPAVVPQTLTQPQYPK